MGLFDRFRNDSKKSDSVPVETKTSVNPMSETADSSDWAVVERGQGFDPAAAFTMPVDELSALGPLVATLLPSFRTVTQTTAVNTTGLYRLANMAAGDSLKVAKGGKFWGAFKKADGGSKMAQLQNAGPLTATQTTVMPIDPACVMVAAALYTIERKLDAIEELQKQIIAFLQTEKEAEIEADLKLLDSTLREFKFNFDKEVFVSGHYKQALDIKRTAEKNMNFYQKKLQDIRVKTPVIANVNINKTLQSVLKDFRYYQMSLYLFSMSSFTEVLLLGDFREDHILKIKDDIEERSMTYRQIYAECLDYVEEMSGKAVDTNVIKGIGSAGKVLGGLIGSIPLVKEGPVDEWLKDGGDVLKQNAGNLGKKHVQNLSVVSNPGTGIFIEKMDEINKICNHTDKIFFDRDRIYLAA